MLDADTRLDVGEDVLAFADATDPLLVYACAAAPRLTVAAGRPELTVLAYRRGSGRPEGGQVTLSTTLGLTETQRDRVAAALALPPPPGADTGPRPRVLAPQWLSGTVTVRLADGVELAGRPSLSGANDCVLTGSLDRGLIAALLAAVDAGLPRATATYAVDVAASRTATATASRERHAPGSSSTLRASVVTTAAAPLHLELTGPLRLPAPARPDAVTTVTLGPPTS